VLWWASHLLLEYWNYGLTKEHLTKDLILFPQYSNW
jgi:hypothetical protein